MNSLVGNINLKTFCILASRPQLSACRRMKKKTSYLKNINRKLGIYYFTPVKRVPIKDNKKE